METEESILRYIGLQGDGDDIDGDEIAGDDEPLCLPEPTVASYVTELLGKGFPPERLEAVGSSVEVEHLLPVLANDTISLSGAVVGKRVSAGQRLVECSLAVDNDQGEPVARAPRRHQPLISALPSALTPVRPFPAAPGWRARRCREFPPPPGHHPSARW